jgi:hypothetical protein
MSTTNTDSSLSKGNGSEENQLQVSASNDHTGLVDPEIQSELRMLSFTSGRDGLEVLEPPIVEPAQEREVGKRMLHYTSGRNGWDALEPPMERDALEEEETCDTIPQIANDE